MMTSCCRRNVKELALSQNSGPATAPFGLLIEKGAFVLAVLAGAGAMFSDRTFSLGALAVVSAVIGLSLFGLRRSQKHPLVRAEALRAQSLAEQAALRARFGDARKSLHAIDGSSG